MNESLSELQDDIQRLSQQQSQMQQMHNIMQNGGQTQASAPMAAGPSVRQWLGRVAGSGGISASAGTGDCRVLKPSVLESSDGAGPWPCYITDT